MNATGDHQLLKRINKSVLLRLLKVQPGLSRAGLATLSGLTKSTVSALVRELLDENWLSEASAPVAVSSVGRPSTPLRINDMVRAFIGVEVAVGSLRVVSVSLTGLVIAQIEVPLENLLPEHVCQQTALMVLRMCEGLDKRGLQLAGVGVCLPGAISDDSGTVHVAPNLGWRDIQFLSMIFKAFVDAGVPSTTICLQNDADAAALSEYEFATADDEGPLIFINCDVGVGAGIVLNDRLFTGAVGLAGEIGHTIMQIDGVVCSCGKRGCAETFIGSRALHKPGGVEQAGRYLGILIQNLDALFNPRNIVVGGKSCVTHPELFDIAVDTLNAYASAARIPVSAVRKARYGLLAAAVGAAALVWHRFLRPIPVGSPSAETRILASKNFTKSAPERRLQSSSQIGVKDVSWS